MVIFFTAATILKFPLARYMAKAVYSIQYTRKYESVSPYEHMFLAECLNYLERVHYMKIYEKSQKLWQPSFLSSVEPLQFHPWTSTPLC